MKLKCLICGKEYHHLGSHLWHGHGVLAREYKEQYGLPYKMALISEQVWQKKHDKFELRRPEYLRNLLKSGTEHRFKKGQTGTRRISEQERQTNIERIKKVNTERKGTLAPCPVCKMQFEHLASHLYNAHKMLQV